MKESEEKQKENNRSVMSFFLLDESIVLKQYKIVEALSDIVSYSVKTNVEVGKVLEANTNCMFSVHTLENLKAIQDKSRVLFFAQSWNDSIINSLFEAGVRMFVVDNRNDYDILKNYLISNKNFNKDCVVFLRMKLKEYTIRTGKYFVFGMHSDEIKDIVNDLVFLKQKGFISSIGIHFHRKTQNVSEWSLKDELEENYDDNFFDVIDYVNIGGGIPSVYKNSSEIMFDSIFSKITELKQWLNSKGIKMVVEPGRFIAAPAVELHTEIIGKVGSTLIVDASIYNSNMDVVINNVRLLVKDELAPGKAGVKYLIKGRTPDSMDIFRYKVLLPEKSVGDKVVFVNAGAYNFHTDFCNLDKIPTITVFSK